MSRISSTLALPSLLLLLVLQLQGVSAAPYNESWVDYNMNTNPSEFRGSSSCLWHRDEVGRADDGGRKGEV